MITNIAKFKISLKQLLFYPKLNKQKNKFLIDGYPRNEENLQGWLKATKLQNLEIQGLLFFECSKETMEKRVQNRSKDSQREDDNQKSFKKRLDTFYNDTMKVKDYFESQKQCITVSAEGSKEDTFNEIQQKLNILLK